MSSSSPPSSRPPSGVPTGGNAKYVLVAVVLIVALGGLLCWRFGNKPPPAPTPLPTASVPPPSTESKLDDVPPPPPVEDAGPEIDAGGNGPKVVRNAFDPCSSKKCAGAATPELESALAVNAKRARRCYDTALAQDPTLKGRISVSVKVGTDGTVCATSLGQNELPNIAGCVENVFRRTASLPAPKGGCVEVTVPMSFIPGR